MIIKRHTNLLGGLLMALILFSCAMGPKFERPEVKSPEKYRFDTIASPDSVLNLKWWELFDDPTLDSLIKIALDSNKNLLQAASRVEQARYNVGVKKADFGPGINIQGGGTRGNFGGGFFVFDDPVGAVSATAGLNWELDFWGKFRRSTESAKAELLASEFGKRTIQIGLITEVAKNYFILLDMRSRYEISENTYASRDSGHKIIEARFMNGIVPEIDVNQSQIQLSISKAAVPTYERRIAAAENNLSILLGQNPDSIVVNKTLYDQEIKGEIPAGIPASILNRRPDVLASEANVHAQTALIGVAQANRMPAISLTGLLGGVSPDLSSFNQGQMAWNASAGFLGPLFEWGKNKRRVQIEREKTEQAILEYENTVITAFAEVEIALKTIETKEEELEARKEQFMAAKNAETLSFARYNKGVTSYLEVLENQRASFEAQLIYSQTYQELLNSYINLYKALGGGWISEEEMNSNNNPE